MSNKSKINNEAVYATNTRTIYEYDPDNGFLICTLSIVQLPNTALNDNSTTTTPPSYDSDIEQIKYDKKADEWEIVSLVEPLKEFKDSAKAEIDTEIKTVLRKNITINAQAAGLYTMKYNEAIRYLADDSPAKITDYPFLEIDVEMTSKSAAVCAKKIIARHDSWQAKLCEMEKIRLKAKAAIDKTTFRTSAKNAKAKIEKIAKDAVEKLYNL